MSKPLTICAATNRHGFAFAQPARAAGRGTKRCFGIAPGRESLYFNAVAEAMKPEIQAEQVEVEKAGSPPRTSLLTKKFFQRQFRFGTRHLEKSR
jgi:hypothetical protein